MKKIDKLFLCMIFVLCCYLTIMYDYGSSLAVLINLSLGLALVKNKSLKK